MVLSVARVELHNVLGSAIGGNIDIDGVADNVEDNTLVARRCGQRATVPEDLRAASVVDELGKVEGTSVANGAGLGDSIDVLEDAVEEAERFGGVSAHFDQEAQDSQGVGCFRVSQGTIWILKRINSPADSKTKCTSAA